MTEDLVNKNIVNMNTIKILTAAALVMGSSFTQAQNVDTNDVIGKSNIQLKSDLMTPEALWAMGRVGACAPSPDGKQLVYQVGYYSVPKNKSRQTLYIMDMDGKKRRDLGTEKSMTDPAWVGNRIAYIMGGEVWTMASDGSDRKQLTKTDGNVEGYIFSPDGKKCIIIKQIPFTDIIQAKPDDLPLTTGLVINDLMHRHWDQYVETIPHPFLCDVTADGISEGKDMLEGEPYECPVLPFGGAEMLCWSPDSKTIAYTSKKKVGRDYAISTDTDIFIYNVETGKTTNICKPVGYKDPEVDATKTLATQSINHQNGDMHVGYDQNPQFSPDGKYIAWQSMARNGYESDRNRLCVHNLATGEETYVTESFDSNVDGFCWGADSKTLYFLGVWHACSNAYKTDLGGNVMQLTEEWSDLVSIAPAGDGKRLIVGRQSFSTPTDLWLLTPGKEKKSKMQQLTDENCEIMSQLEMGKVQQRWVATTDGKKELVWIILPPHFDPEKKYPTLLFCEGGPQSPVSQFWSFRWNFQIMAANGYIIVAPNRHGLPGFGSEWCEEISGDWTGQCMNDYLSAIDDACTLPYVDKDRLGCVGASFGGFSVYYLAGHHDKRFKAFISHDGAFNLESMYTDTEEDFFSNWEYDDAYWNKDMTERARRTYENSPHKFVDKWDTPILCIHGEKDYRIVYNQGMGAFNAARMRGIPAQLLLFPDENHWVLKPQNGILWQRTFFGWLDKWLK